MKNNLKYFVSLMLLILMAGNVHAQQLKEIHIGDRLPDIKLTGFYKDTTATVELKELYKNKLLLLDFWGTWCAACLEEFPKFNELKKKFGNQIQIVAVGYESYQKINNLFKRNPALNSPDYLVLTKDSVLARNLFPHKTLPHVVWIDSTGKVIMISEGEDVTEANIQNALENKPIAAKPKIDNMSLGIEAISLPFRIMDTNYICRSILTKTVPGWLSFSGLQGEDSTGNKFNRVFMGNITIKNLYWLAIFHRKLSGENYSRLIFEIQDSLKYMEPKWAPESFKHSKYKSYSEWEDANLYCYELVMPFKVQYDILYDYMLSDLNRYLNLNGRFEQREMNCYVMKTQKKREQILLTAEAIRSMYYKTHHFESLTISKLTDLLNGNIANGYIVNESDLPVDLTFNLDTDLKKGLTVNKINYILEKFGLTIVHARREIPVYIVSEIK